MNGTHPRAADLFEPFQVAARHENTLSPAGKEVLNDSVETSRVVSYVDKSPLGHKKLAE